MSSPWDSPSDDTYEYGMYTPLTIGEILFSFEGRISRSTYWFASLGAGVVFMAVLFAVLFAVILVTDSETMANVVSLVMYIPMAWVSFAIQAKRWHDRGKSGFWIFIGFIPIIGPIWSFIELGLLEGDLGANKFGPATY